MTMVRRVIGNFLRSKYSYGLFVPVAIIEIAMFYRLLMARDVFVLEPPMSHFEKQVWVIYKAGFANPATDGQAINYGDWNLDYGGYTSSKLKLPFEISSKVFPQMGLYSSHDKVLIKTHMRMIARHGIDGIIIPWVPKHIDNGFIDSSVKIILKQAKKIGISVAVQVISYNGRDRHSINKDINYIASNYGGDEIYLKFDGKPVIFFEDPNDIDDIQNVIYYRKNELFMVTSLTSFSQVGYALENGFCGINTQGVYSNYTSWDLMHKDAVERGLLFIPMVSPGFEYFGTSISRKSGKYYKELFTQAINSGARIILINSFNDWAHGTQIENIVERDDYMPNENTWGGPPNYYLELTKSLIKDFKDKKA